MQLLSQISAELYNEVLKKLALLDSETLDYLLNRIYVANKTEYVVIATYLFIYFYHLPSAKVIYNTLRIAIQYNNFTLIFVTPYL